MCTTWVERIDPEEGQSISQAPCMLVVHADDRRTCHMTADERVGHRLESRCFVVRMQSSTVPSHLDNIRHLARTAFVRPRTSVLNLTAWQRPRHAMTARYNATLSLHECC
jgi:hypothetical protein